MRCGAVRKVIEEAWKTFSRDELPEAVPDATLAVVQLNLARYSVCVNPKHWSRLSEANFTSKRLVLLFQG